MKKIELEIIRINEDVIATSCENEFPIVHSNGTKFDSALGNKEVVESPQDKNYMSFISFLNSYSSFQVPAEGYYHINLDGSIGQKCDDPQSHDYMIYG